MYDNAETMTAEERWLEEHPDALFAPGWVRSFPTSPEGLGLST